MSFNTVKSWARRHWKLKKGETVAAKSCKKVQPRPHGAPVGNKNNLIHGAYQKVSLDAFEDKEYEYMNYIALEPEQILKDIYVFYKIRERRLLILLFELNRIERSAFYERITHITRKKTCNKTKQTVTHIPAPIHIFAVLNSEVTKIQSGIIENAILLHKIRTAKKPSFGTVKKIYNMAETAGKINERINKIISKLLIPA